MKCGKIATYRYTWPGSDEKVCCDEHAKVLTALVNAMGFRLQLVPIPPVDDVVCTMETKIKEKEN